MSVRWSVGPRVDLLRRDVGRRAEGLALAGFLGVLDDLLRQAEIGQHDVVGAVDEEVGRLDVEVDDVRLVRGMERGDGVAQEPLRVLLVEPALGLDPVLEGLALDVGHAEEDDVAFLADEENRDDVRDGAAPRRRAPPPGNTGRNSGCAAYSGRSTLIAT